MLAGGVDGPHALGLAAGVACVTGQPGTARVFLPHSTQPCRGTRGAKGRPESQRHSSWAWGWAGGLASTSPGAADGLAPGSH